MCVAEGGGPASWVEKRAQRSTGLKVSGRCKRSGKSEEDLSRQHMVSEQARTQMFISQTVYIGLFSINLRIKYSFVHVMLEHTQTMLQ